MLTGPLIEHLFSKICPDSPALDLGEPFPGDRMGEDDLAGDYARRKAEELGFSLWDRPWPDLIKASQDDRSGDWERVLERCLLSPELQARTDFLYPDLLPSLLWELRVPECREAFEAALKAKLVPKANAVVAGLSAEALDTRNKKGQLGEQIEHPAADQPRKQGRGRPPRIPHPHQTVCF